MARPAQEPRNPLTRRRARSFCGAGGSTVDKRMQDTEAAQLLCPGGASPCKVLPQQHPCAPQNAGGSGEGIFHKEHHYNWPSWEGGTWCYKLGLRRCSFFFFN